MSRNGYLYRDRELRRRHHLCTKPDVQCHRADVLQQPDVHRIFDLRRDRNLPDGILFGSRDLRRAGNMSGGNM